MSKQLNVEFGATTIPFDLCFSDRKTLAIEVNPDKSVVVVAPKGTPLKIVRQRVKKRSAWIRKQQLDFVKYLPTEPPRKFVSGETHLYLGRKYRLKTFKDESTSVKLSRGQISLSLLQNRDSEAIKGLLESWYRTKAQVVFQEVLERCLEIMRRLQIETPSLQIRKMKTRWGSCTKSGKILLNLELIKAPKKCIEYVVTHELCHLVEFNHGKNFYKLLTRTMPDWLERKRKLDKVFLL
jgi:predicted metal-dependent hydrolase